MFEVHISKHSLSRLKTRSVVDCAHIQAFIKNSQDHGRLLRVDHDAWHFGPVDDRRELHVPLPLSATTTATSSSAIVGKCEQGGKQSINQKCF